MYNADNHIPAGAYLLIVDALLFENINQVEVLFATDFTLLILHLKFGSQLFALLEQLLDVAGGGKFADDIVSIW